MARQYYQNPHYDPGQYHIYQPPYQPYHYPDPLPNLQDTYNDGMSPVFETLLGISLTRESGRVLENPRDRSYSNQSNGLPQPYLMKSHKMPNLIVNHTHQQGRQGSYGYPSTGSSDDHLFYPGSGLVNGGGSDRYLPPGGGYNAARPQDRKAAGYYRDRGHDSRPKPPKRPRRPPANTHHKQCIMASQPSPDPATYPSLPTPGTQLQKPLPSESDSVNFLLSLVSWHLDNIHTSGNVEQTVLVRDVLDNFTNSSAYKRLLPSSSSRQPPFPGTAMQAR